MYLHSNLHVENVPSTVDSLIFRATHVHSSITLSGKIGRLFFYFQTLHGRKNEHLLITFINWEVLTGCFLDMTNFSTEHKEKWTKMTSYKCRMVLEINCDCGGCTLSLCVCVCVCVRARVCVLQDKYWILKLYA
jgi:hypothetical protein